MNNAEALAAFEDSLCSPCLGCGGLKLFSNCDECRGTGLERDVTADGIAKRIEKERRRKSAFTNIGSMMKQRYAASINPVPSAIVVSKKTYDDLKAETKPKKRKKS